MAVKGKGGSKSSSGTKITFLHEKKEIPKKRIAKNFNVFTIIFFLL